MTGYTDILNISIDADSLGDVILLTATRDNAIAIGEGDLTVPATARRGRHALIYIREEQTAGTHGGTFTSGAWQTRVLNTEVNDSGGNATLASNQITLVAGTYEFNARCPCVRVDQHKCRLQNITDSTTIAVGSSSMAKQAVASSDRSSAAYVSGMFTISSSKIIELQHRCTTTFATQGFGVGDATAGGVEVFSEIILRRLL